MSARAASSTGWRIGYACGPAALVDAMMKVHQYTMLCASIIAQEAALEALLRGWDDVLRMREQYHRRRDLVVRRFNEIGLKCHSPRGSFYAFPDVTATGRTEKDFAFGLLEQEKVAVVPGNAFGDNGTGHVRACFATSYEQLIVACDRIERFVGGAKGSKG
jgi:aminotransferase